ncbi:MULTISPECIES: cysteine synthase A [unclassified Fusibacter]|uniref:cysteine synthase A n=1 Tax=unclassified Fusibacter TaxID=2624464 RepID=UPI001010FD7F|nr:MULTISPECIES: cysteine synthase A [unclassified Fusibacter]MCK8060596.1 cysteine synthase A [Fusibacter sp. A2]NPE22950.1 cysteine synthase A [Fusibacter sp. A1]RXV60017.1 cysteine synthase A [Fusibacter sp. A1]
MTKKALRELIGNTPVVELKGDYGNEYTKIFVKLEKFNLGGSVKDRAALGMIEGALNEGFLRSDGTIIEPTSGNTGISIALIGQLLGLKVKIVMPETMSKERRQFITAYGAELILTPGDQGMKGAIETARRLASEDHSSFVPMQFSNRHNTRIHYETTGPEILSAVPEVTCFVAGVGSGGTISGVGKYLKESLKEVEVVAVEPAESAVLSGRQPGAHKIQGIGAGFIPENFDPSVVDKIKQVSDEQAAATCKRIAKEKGLLLGVSSGAAIFAAEQLANESKDPMTIVVLAPDGGERYLSLGIF